MTLTPCDRDYRGRSAAAAGLLAGHDFLCDGAPVNIGDLVDRGITSVVILYTDHSSVTVRIPGTYSMAHRDY